MISIIVCSRKKNISQKLIRNIQKSIGTEYELIVIDNSLNKYSIFSAYNEGVRISKYAFLCFIHEDILFHTKEWGKRVISHLVDDKIGIIGVAGGKYLSALPSPWWYSNIEVDKMLETSEPAIALDGLFLCMKKNLFKNIQFDEVSFNGFHAYDLDICLQSICLLNKENRIVSDIEIQHFSSGPTGKSWFEAVREFNKKWIDYLPIKTANYEITEKTEFNILIGIIRKMRELKYEDILIAEEVNLIMKNPNVNLPKERGIVIQCAYLFLISQSDKINTRAYRLGFNLLKPLKFIRNIRKL